MHQIFFKIERQIRNSKRTNRNEAKKNLKANNLFPRLGPVQFIPRHNGANDLSKLSLTIIQNTIRYNTTVKKNFMTKIMPSS